MIAHAVRHHGTANTMSAVLTSGAHNLYMGMIPEEHRDLATFSKLMNAMQLAKRGRSSSASATRRASRRSIPRAVTASRTGRCSSTSPRSRSSTHPRRVENLEPGRHRDRDAEEAQEPDDVRPDCRRGRLRGGLQPDDADLDEVKGSGRPRVPVKLDLDHQGTDDFLDRADIDGDRAPGRAVVIARVVNEALDRSRLGGAEDLDRRDPDLGAAGAVRHLERAQVVRPPWIRAGITTGRVTTWFLSFTLPCHARNTPSTKKVATSATCENRIRRAGLTACSTVVPRHEPVPFPSEVRTLPDAGEPPAI